jgi:hypothetical protein
MLEGWKMNTKAKPDINKQDMSGKAKVLFRKASL